MYAPFFGLRQSPFSMAPDPHMLFMSKRHREALAHLLYGVGGGGATALVLGLDIGQAIAPLIFGVMMDHGQYPGVLLGVLQAVLIVSAFNLGRVRRTALASV